jgi:hypothetical protein
VLIAPAKRSQRLRDRHRLLARVIQMRRLNAGVGMRKPPGGSAPPVDDRSLEQRVAHLEEMLEGLQDALHRATVRQDKRITDLEARLEPAALAVALSRDARERGL